ncbi:MAG: hypothetical protein H0A75_09205 [Candidatus Methanofishera endochildressiae]|uniref:Uncharacterized protein n=1 Tax=Candidatus Methanofishera endochildressiae TaxID=2738884 RepID=A0A7Z0MPU9_9GAMM|nr:hypothetical protein [Candidatus Methanofishera endochildressiae]
MQRVKSAANFQKNSSRKIGRQAKGTKSPNLADAVVMCYNPVTKKKATVIARPKILR